MAGTFSKQSSEHKFHVEQLKVAAKAGDAAAAANLKQHEVVKPAEVKNEEKTTEPKK